MRKFPQQLTAECNQCTMKNNNRAEIVYQIFLNQAVPSRQTPCADIPKIYHCRTTKETTFQKISSDSFSGNAYQTLADVPPE